MGDGTRALAPSPAQPVSERLNLGCPDPRHWAHRRRRSRRPGAFKVGTGAGGADNYRVGETGNGVAYVDLDTGLLGPALVPRPGRLGPIPASELDGHPIEGRPMPLLAECLDLVTRHAHAFLPMRTLGWDIALTARGPVVVEVNNFWASPHGPLTDEAWDLFFRG